MSTSSTAIDSKSAKKRRAKADPSSVAGASTGRGSPLLDTKVNGSPSIEGAHEGTNGTAEHPYLRELSKNIRNITKKLGSSGKADSIIEQNPGVSLEELVAQKKLNADQKAQLLKKPQLQAQLAQLEEQHKAYQTLLQELEEKFGQEKEALTRSHEKALAQAKEEAAQFATTSQSGTLEQGLKVITGFLHAAAAKRLSDDTDSDEAKAFEGALLLIYQGNSSSFNTLRNLVEGSADKVPDTESNLLEYTFAQVKEAALADVTALSDEIDGTADASTTGVDSVSVIEPASDPTIANAGLTELEDTNPLADTKNEPTIVSSTIPEQASITAEAANAVAGANWDSQAAGIADTTPSGEDWVQVPRDPAETDTGSVQPAAQQSTANWADEAGDAALEQKATTNENDGFEQVRRDRGGRGRGPRGRGFDGRGRGRGRGDGYRGRGGQGRGRGAGGSGSGGQRGDRAPATS